MIMFDRNSHHSSVHLDIPPSLQRVSLRINMKISLKCYNTCTARGRHAIRESPTTAMTIDGDGGDGAPSVCINPIHPGISLRDR